METHATIEELLKMVFPIQFVQQGYKEDKRSKRQKVWRGGHPTKTRPWLSNSNKNLMGLDTKTDYLTDRQSQCDFDFEIRGSWKGTTIQRGLQPERKGIAIVQSRCQETAGKNNEG
jgi:hypothetical protein